MQNGLGNEEFLAKNFGAERVLGGLCFICLSRISRTTVERYDYGHIVLGEYGRASRERTLDLAAEFKRCGVTCSVADDLALERWRKLVWNIPFNGLSILGGGVDTSAILADESLRRSAVALMDEVIAAANSCGYSLEDADAEQQLKRTEAMEAYKPSTLLDFEAGKPLEVEAIWGEPLRRAMAAGATAPRLEILYSLLKSVDRAGNALPRSTMVNHEASCGTRGHSAHHGSQPSARRAHQCWRSPSVGRECVAIVSRCPPEARDPLTRITRDLRLVDFGSAHGRVTSTIS